VDVACKQRLVDKRSKFFADQFLVNLSHLRREGILAGPTVADVARYLRIAFQCSPDGLDLSLCLLRRLFGYQDTDLFRSALKKACWSSKTVPSERGPWPVQTVLAPSFLATSRVVTHWPTSPSPT